MLFTPGARVKLVHTREKGVVVRVLDEGMVLVRLLEEGLEIPVAAEDLRLLEAAGQSAPRKSPRPGSERPASLQDPEPQFTRLKSEGILLAFVPLNAPPTEFQTFLLNDTSRHAVFSLRLRFGDQVEEECSGKLPAHHAEPVGHLLLDDLNDGPTYELECREDSTAGLGPLLQKSLKIKPKTFFKKFKTAPLLHKGAHLFPLFPSLDAPESPQEEDLPTYTRRRARPRSAPSDLYRPVSPYAPDELAAFVPEVDLHIDKLRSDWRKLSKAEILRIQLDAFDRFMEKAIRLGAERVFIVHGVGKGRLRDEIASRLLQMPEVRSFKNEYHPRYGWGATEVEL
ncbi:MAG: hypothetical protein D6765_11695 [Bacteroidetes bacterium]|nr:MAG: hypothetical protein D6765_11695 [Bacteroidota bacterium]